jgi:uncharacterized RDD family membrane protein YckC
MIDALVLIPISVLLTIALGEEVLATEESRNATNLLVDTIVIALFEHVFLVKWSATPGKLLLGIYVGTLDGRAISPFQAVLRYLAVASFFVNYFLPAAGIVILALFLISYMMALTDPQRRSLHDRIASTRVLVGKPPAPYVREESAFPRL